ncbi:hypothetical protein VE01_06054 [Pseudogymnoascus verrucosus]|uniref:Uncharacterized protein n=1 Tax=Pseudogymnoascus verrucosus TaxID=342668 RepID=A0A1B8GJA6_9PEZI|nr:uncharacterized protein VE01_06054 [Pseudogymnoascus verrucosus]OBT95899.1 hypothetical protein VE01_06054 [Pseudogymnoascus verrucosus]
MFNGTGVDIFVRCAETTYHCNRTLRGEELFLINSTNEAVPADCEKETYSLQPSWFSGLLAMPGLTELSGISIIPYYNHGPHKITSIELPDLVNITGGISIIDADSISNFSVPKLKHIDGILELNFTGGPAIDFHYTGTKGMGRSGYSGYSSYSISIDSSGNLDCNAFAASVVNSTGYERNGVSCTSKKGSITLTQPKPEVTSTAFRIHGGGFLALIALLAYILAL